MTASSRVEHYAVTVPAGTPQATPAETATDFAPGTVNRILVTFPAGCAGLVGVQLAVAHQPIIPWTPDQFMAYDDYVRDMETILLPNSGAWSMIAYNLDVFDHTISVEFEITEVDLQTLPAQAAPEADTASAETPAPSDQALYAGLPPDTTSADLTSTDDLTGAAAPDGTDTTGQAPPDDTTAPATDTTDQAAPVDVGAADVTDQPPSDVPEDAGTLGVDVGTLPDDTSGLDQTAPPALSDSEAPGDDLTDQTGDLPSPPLAAPQAAPTRPTAHAKPAAKPVARPAAHPPAKHEPAKHEPAKPKPAPVKHEPPKPPAKPAPAPRPHPITAPPILRPAPRPAPPAAHPPPAKPPAPHPPEPHPPAKPPPRGRK